MNQSDQKRNAKRRRRRVSFRVILLGLAGFFGLVLAELGLFVAAPQEMMSPRYRFSPEYGARPFPNVTMVHSKRGSFRFRYTTNRNGFRGEEKPISNRYDIPNIVIIGDSRSFGMGADDGEQYPHLLQHHLGQTANVVNLGCPSWGLTQQIRCFYERGQLYKPEIVILQTNANDVEDNQINKVTTVTDGKFTFHDSPNSANWVKRYLSESWIQKSNLYNLVRDDLYQWLTRRTVDLPQGGGETANTPDSAQQFYIELLSAFAKDLKDAGVKLIVFSHEIDFRFSPKVDSHIRKLDESGMITYCPLDPWLEGKTDYESPEGHLLGTLGHKIAAQGLAVFLGSDEFLGNESESHPLVRDDATVYSDGAQDQ